MQGRSGAIPVGDKTFMCKTIRHSSSSSSRLVSFLLTYFRSSVPLTCVLISSSVQSRVALPEEQSGGEHGLVICKPVNFVFFLFPI